MRPRSSAVTAPSALLRAATAAFGSAAVLEDAAAGARQPIAAGG
jgi:hypothetical protein